MQSRNHRSILAFATAAALAAAVLAPTAAVAKGPGPGPGPDGCGADCTADAVQVKQQIRARDGSADAAQQQIRARDGSARSERSPAVAKGGRQMWAHAAVGGNQARQATNGNGSWGYGPGPNAAGQHEPGTCDACTAEMGTLTDEQAAGLVFMANEEKLAHDVYATFAERYGVPIFGNIAASEARHQEAVNTILERYGLEDSAISLPPGEFSDAGIAALYEQLIEQGSTSLEEAIAVGVLIEETDIADLESRLADLGGTGLDETVADDPSLETGAPDVYQLYSHLVAASRNHLSAFERWM
jgi:hypothetical protein